MVIYPEVDGDLVNLNTATLDTSLSWIDNIIRSRRVQGVPIDQLTIEVRVRAKPRHIQQGIKRVKAVFAPEALRLRDADNRLDVVEIYREARAYEG